MAGDIHYFANKEETGDFAGFHGFAGKFVGVHTDGGRFGFSYPFVNLTLESFERLIRPIGWSVQVEPRHVIQTGSVRPADDLPTHPADIMWFHYPG